MRLKVGQFGFWLLVFVGYCGEVPVSLVRRMDGYYDYNRRVVTKLVREGYLKERKLRVEQRHVVRSLSLTEAGLRKIQNLSPNHAAQVRQHEFAPRSGQGDWSRTQRLHRGAACLLAAMKLGAVWKPGKARDAAHGKRLVYYSTYQLNKSFGKDNKSARASGILVTKHSYYPVYYLGNRNMRWNKETELRFRDQFEQSELGCGFSYGGNILLGETWELAERVASHAINPRSRLIHFMVNDMVYYSVLNDCGMVFLRAAMDSLYLYRLQQWLKERCGCPVSMHPDYLFRLETITDLDPYEGLHWFFDFQIPVVKNLAASNVRLVSMPAALLGTFHEMVDHNESDTDGLKNKRHGEG